MVAITHLQCVGCTQSQSLDFRWSQIYILVGCKSKPWWCNIYQHLSQNTYSTNPSNLFPLVWETPTTQSTSLFISFLCTLLFSNFWVPSGWYLIPGGRDQLNMPAWILSPCIWSFESLLEMVSGEAYNIVYHEFAMTSIGIYRFFYHFRNVRNKAHQANELSEGYKSSWTNWIMKG